MIILRRGSDHFPDGRIGQTWFISCLFFMKLRPQKWQVPVFLWMAACWERTIFKGDNDHQILFITFIHIGRTRSRPICKSFWKPAEVEERVVWQREGGGKGESGTSAPTRDPLERGSPALGYLFISVVLVRGSGEFIEDCDMWPFKLSIRCLHWIK